MSSQTIRGVKMKIIIPTALAMIILAIQLCVPVTSFGMAVGDKAPAFNGESTQGTIRLADFSGKKNVVLALYFAIFTPV